MDMTENKIEVARDGAYVKVDADQLTNTELEGVLSSIIIDSDEFISSQEIAEWYAALNETCRRLEKEELKMQMTMYDKLKEMRQKLIYCVHNIPPPMQPFRSEEKRDYCVRELIHLRQDCESLMDIIYKEGSKKDNGNTLREDEGGSRSVTQTAV